MSPIDESSSIFEEENLLLVGIFISLFVLETSLSFSLP